LLRWILPRPADEPDVARLLHDELDRLPQRYRVVIVLCYLEKEPPVNGENPVHSLDAMRRAKVRGMAPFATAEAKAGDFNGVRATLVRAIIVADRIRERMKPEPLALIAMSSPGPPKEFARECATTARIPSIASRHRLMGASPCLG
jgi:hypothetical protein